MMVNVSLQACEMWSDTDINEVKIKEKENQGINYINGIALLVNTIHNYTLLIPLFIEDMHVLQDCVTIAPQGYNAVIYCPVIIILCAQQVFHQLEQWSSAQQRCLG